MPVGARGHPERNQHVAGERERQQEADRFFVEADLREIEHQDDRDEPVREHPRESRGEQEHNVALGGRSLRTVDSAIDEPVVDDRKNLRGHIFLRAGDRRDDVAGRRDDFDLVIGRADRLGAVGDHQVAEFALELGQRAKAVIFRFQGKADDPAAGLFSRRAWRRRRRFR